MSVIDQKKITRNTIFLYLRMVLMLVIGLYTSRVILDALGERDFGIYNSVGGIVAAFSFISGTLSTACQRFYMVEIGKRGNLRETFCLSLTVFAALAVVVILICEPSGLWILENRMKVDGRMDAARWVFQFSILSFILTMLRIPYQGMVISREKMQVFAYLSLIEAILTLGITLLIRNSTSDRLVEYSGAMVAVPLIITSGYVFYCLRNYPECRFRFCWNSEKFRELFSFTGWNFIGTAAGVFKIQGINILLNVVFGPLVSAARGIAFKVYGAITQLQENFMTASRPQIIKAHAAGETEGMKKLIYQSSRFGAFLMLLVAVPVILEMDFLLGKWLLDVPDGTALFATLMLINALIDYIDYPVWVSIQANGQIKEYQLVVGLTMLGIVPISYAVLKFADLPPESVFYVSIAVSVITIFERMFLSRKLVGLKPSDFIVKSLLPVAAVCCVTVGAGIAVRMAMDPGWARMMAVAAACVCTEAGCVLSFGMTRSEKDAVYQILKSHSVSLFKHKQP